MLVEISRTDDVENHISRRMCWLLLDIINHEVALNNAQIVWHEMRELRKESRLLGVDYVEGFGVHVTDIKHVNNVVVVDNLTE
jgi:hypothetical protein